MPATSRNYSTSSRGSGFDEATIQAVWNKGQTVPGINPDLRRKDGCGAWIDRAEYGQTTEFGTGWEIDHINPISNGGTDALSNLQPLQWQNNRRKGDNLWGWSCAVVAKN